MDTHNVGSFGNDFKSPVPDRHQAEEHIRLLTGSVDTPVCFRALGPNGGARKINGTLAERWVELANLNLQGYQLYLVVNEGGHDSAAITGIRALFVDADGQPMPDRWHVLPSFVVQRDAEHWHAYWLVHNMPVSDFTAAQKRLIARYGTDPGIHDLPRIMRLAGSVHLKGPEQKGDGIPRPVTIAEWDAWAGAFDPAHLMQGLPEVTPNVSSTEPAAAYPHQPADDPLDLAAAVAMLQNPDLDWTEWDTIGMAIHAATGGSEIGRAMWLAFSEKSRKFNQKDALERWNHWFRSPATTIGAGKIYALAKEASPAWERPSRMRTEAKMIAGITMPAADHDALFRTGADLTAHDPTPIEELIAGLVEKHCVAYVSAPGGLHKSRIAQHWGACVHTGTAVYGRAVERAHFVHVSYENGDDEDARRHHTLLRRLEIEPAALADYIYCGWKGRGPLVVISEAGEIAPTPLWTALETRLRAIPAHKFVVFDSLYNVFAFTGQAKINETAVQGACDWLDNQMVALDASGLMLMHPSQAGIARGDNSGWSVAWVNRPRVRIALKAIDGRDDVVELSVAKRSNSMKGRPITLHWHDGLMTPDVDATEQRAVYKAIITVARNAANGSRMLKKGSTVKQSGVDHLIVDEIERLCGIRVGLSEIHRMLARAEFDGYLIYHEYDKNKRGEDAKAGYRAGPKSFDAAPWEDGFLSPV